MRIVLALALVASPAAADTFGGFSGVDRPYLVNQDRACTPLEVSGGAATGVPKCEKVAADVLAKLSIKDGVEQRGDKATFAAAADGKVLTVTRKDGGAVAVTWSAPDPIGKVVAVYASPYEDRVAVTYTTRRLGKEVTDVVAFELTKTMGKAVVGTVTSADGQPISTTTTTTGPSTSATEDPAVKAAADAARKAPRAIAGWKKVLTLDAAHAEALYRVAALEIGAKHTDLAVAALEQLAASPRPDAIEWRVEARFDNAFASLRAEPKFRAAVGLDRPAQGAYERLMGFGGQWEQTGTSCDKAEVRLQIQRERSLKLAVSSVCEGRRYADSFRGTWRLEGDLLVITLPNQGQKATAKDETSCRFERSGDEDALHCKVGKDLDFVALPTRR